MYRNDVIRLKPKNGMEFTIGNYKFFFMPKYKPVWHVVGLFD